MRVDSRVHEGIDVEDAAFVHAAIEKSGSAMSVVQQATDRIRRSQGKLLVTLVLIERARRAARSQPAYGSALIAQGR